MVVPKGSGSSIRISIINRHPSADWTADFRLQGFEAKNVKVQELYSDDMDAAVCPSVSSWRSRLTLT